MIALSTRVATTYVCEKQVTEQQQNNQSTTITTGSVDTSNPQQQHDHAAEAMKSSGQLPHLIRDADHWQDLQMAVGRIQDNSLKGADSSMARTQV